MIEAIGDQADAPPVPVFRRCARNEYVPTPPSGTNVPWRPVWVDRHVSNEDDPGRLISTSNTNPDGGASEAHRIVNLVSMPPFGGDATRGTDTLPFMNGWIMH